MRAIVSILVGSMIFLSASLSNALAFTFTSATSSSGRALNELLPGDEITIGIRMSNPSGATIFGVGAGIQGWNNSILAFVSAEMNPGPYFCTTASCGAGLENNLSFPADPATGNFIAGPSDVQNIAGVGNYLPLVQAIATTGRSGTGQRDPGLDGVVNGGDAQFRVVFLIAGPGTTTITIGTNANPTLGNVVVLAGGATELAQNAFVTALGDGGVVLYPPIPEPGTALLVGLGLAGLAVLPSSRLTSSAWLRRRRGERAVLRIRHSALLGRAGNEWTLPMRRLLPVLLGSMILLSSSFASALAFTFTGATVSSGRPLNALLPGDLVTIGIRMSNPSGATIFGVGAGIQGWDNSILTFERAEMNPGPYFCTTASCGAGLENGLSFPADENTGNFIALPNDVQSVPGVGNYLPLVQAIATTGRSGNGARDPGLDGVVNGGDAQFRIVFRIGSGIGTTTITIGTNANPTLGNVVVLAGGQTEPAQNAFVTWVGDGVVLSQVPEPGTALLVGLGLTILAARSRRAA